MSSIFYISKFVKWGTFKKSGVLLKHLIYYIIKYLDEIRKV